MCWSVCLRFVSRAVVLNPGYILESRGHLKQQWGLGRAPLYLDQFKLSTRDSQLLVLKSSLGDFNAQPGLRPLLQNAEKF